MSISIFQSLVLLSTPVLKPKLSRWSLVSKFMHKGAVSCEENAENMKELESVEFSLGAISSEEAKYKGLECMYRRLVKTRASLLNIISH
ncbi:hypothetical protein AAG906_015733 [Vitis piasezkii]